MRVLDTAIQNEDNAGSSMRAVARGGEGEREWWKSWLRAYMVQSISRTLGSVLTRCRAEGEESTRGVCKLGIIHLHVQKASPVPYQGSQRGTEAAD
jgi:hypothetical protein